ncbi:MAG: SDR family oxidoreductase, partial [Myxococcota bacterium]|nr:SDR family oxidoreductase [Myxococcota bacterium]
MSAGATGSGAPARRVVLLTGATGFLGKVVLGELLRRRAELAVERIFVLVRARGDRGAQHRFERDVATAECFADLPAGWQSLVVPIHCDLEQPGCGLAFDDWRRLTREVTHVIHSAASVDFDLPLVQATSANVGSVLHVLELARACRRLVHAVTVSTAYVTPHPGDGVPVEETLAPLPQPAADLLAAIRSGAVREDDLLEATGHPNTYTLTKCLAEHLWVERGGDLPRSIVRPSIISAAWRRPLPGWIDSSAAFAAFVSLIGTGYLRAVIGDLDARIDLVPVDWVAERTIEVSGAPPRAGGVPIHHVTAGLAQAPSILDCRERILGFFTSHPVARPPRVAYVGPRGWRFRLAEALHQRLPVRLAGLRSARDRKRGRRLLDRLETLNAIFPYFTGRSFDFRSGRPLALPGFDPQLYVSRACRGIHRNLLGGDRSAHPLAGRGVRGRPGDARWALGQPNGSALIRVAGWAVSKVLRRCTQLVSIDADSFERARRGVPPGSVLVLAPSHRSYLDFVLCSYLAFAHPDLRIALPKVAAAREFARIPLLGRALTGLGAFYLERGRGREDKELTRQVHELVREGRTLEFFVEGSRSRSRRFLPPKRGVLRSLQATGVPCALLPVAVSYDRVPEEGVFAGELRGDPRPPMRLGALLSWSLRALRGQLDLGRIHLSCDEPLCLDLESDVHAVSQELLGRLQRSTCATTYHLRAFVARAGVPGLDVDWLRGVLEARGVRVLDSSLDGAETLDPVLAGCVRHHFEHAFFPELRAAFGWHPVVVHQLRRNAHAEPPARDLGAALEDARMRDLLRALFEPVCRDYALAAASLGDPSGAPRVRTPAELARRERSAWLPNLEAAFSDLVERGVLVCTPGGDHAWGPRADYL